MNLHVVILAAGQGTRMRSKLPKVLHPVAGKPMLGHVIDCARSLSPTRIHVVIGHGAELVREQLLAVVREELPHSIATRVTEWEWPRIRCEILVERNSQKGIVIGRKGSVLKEVGTKARAQLPDGVFLELFVRVDKDWQRRPRALDRLGY